MTAAGRQVAAGRVGKPHGLDGSFYVDGPNEPLAVGSELTLAGRPVVVERRAGTDDRPIVRVTGVGDRDAAGGLRGEPLLVDAGELEEGEYLIEDLVGCEVPGIGTVRAVSILPSCDVLEVGEERVLVPLVSDAVKSVDLDARVISVDRGFLGLEEGPS
ncbi:MAG: rRNA processing protein RimM [Thermoleophilaceae bacterium]|nr:rRNA processing protein RimM [Thermoleophilaceae bacterium]